MGDNKKTSSPLGKVWLVGAGPSDLGLFTLKGKRVLEQADVVVYDKLVGQGILSLMPRDAKKINVGKVAGNHPVPQEEINKILLREAQEGNRVVRLKGGDPFLFGRGGEELELLTEYGIPFEIVPGVTSAISVPAYNGIPVTHRDFCSSLHIITGHTKKSASADIDYQSLVKLNGTLVFLMGVAAMPSICQGLMEAGMDPDMPAAVLERGTTPHQRRVVSTLKDLVGESNKARIQTPAIIVVDKVCSLAEHFHWVEDRPLGHLKVLITRPKDRGSTLTAKLQELGAEVLEAPALETDMIENDPQIEEELERLQDYQWLAFTSPYGVKAFFQKLGEMKKDIRDLKGLKIAAVGQTTRKAIEERGIMVDLMPKEYYGAALGEALAERILEEEKRDTGGGQSDLRRQRILIPRAKIGT
jgi:uroporphyrinogen III methyltransferase/synthase